MIVENVLETRLTAPFGDRIALVHLPMRQCLFMLLLLSS